MRMHPFEGRELIKHAAEWTAIAGRQTEALPACRAGEAKDAACRGGFTERIGTVGHASMLPRTGGGAERRVSRARSGGPGSVMFRPTNPGGPAMDDVANLEKAREQLMAQRRSLAEAMAGGYQRGETERQMELFRSIQGTLADIEEAITDERRRAPQRGSKEFSERPYGEKPEDRPL